MWTCFEIIVLVRTFARDEEDWVWIYVMHWGASALVGFTVSYTNYIIGWDKAEKIMIQQNWSNIFVDWQCFLRLFEFQNAETFFGQIIFIVTEL